ncbi:hypothetical protein [Helicobacter pylori]|uniref:hypothetical protein n=1 Tax=Helicobacter pylori TaxID=210 RepID=UPI000BEEFDC1|nr:hypothetical protein [Helicobacter pylori]OPG43340.1 hypothetical protein BGL66_03770 [Helicobacter pylori]
MLANELEFKFQLKESSWHTMNNNTKRNNSNNNKHTNNNKKHNNKTNNIDWGVCGGGLRATPSF